MGEFSIMHLLVILVIVLIFFGPGRLPTLGKSIGEAIRGFKKGLDNGPEQPPQNTAAPHPNPVQQNPRQVHPLELGDSSSPATHVTHTESKKERT